MSSLWTEMSFCQAMSKGKTAKMISIFKRQQKFHYETMMWNQSFLLMKKSHLRLSVRYIYPLTFQTTQIGQIKKMKLQSYNKLFSINTMLLVLTLKVQVFPSKYSKLIKVAVFFDTGALYTIMNPDVLPTEYQKKKKNSIFMLPIMRSSLQS